PTENGHACAFGCVVDFNTLDETIHEDGNSGDGQTTEGAYNTGLGNAGGEVTSQNSGFVSIKDLTDNVCNSGVIVVINDREFGIGVGFGGCLGGVTNKETNGHNQITLVFNEGVEELLVISDFFGLEVFAFDSQCFLG